MAICSTTRIDAIPAAAPVADAGRRNRLFKWAVHSRSRRVILLVLGIWLLNGFDLALTCLAHDQGVLQEGNPVARYFLARGTYGLVLFKVGLVLIGSYPLLRFRKARITELGTLVILVAYASLAFHWQECYELYSITAENNIHMAELGRLPIE